MYRQKRFILVVWMSAAFALAAWSGAAQQTDRYDQTVPSRTDQGAQPGQMGQMGHTGMAGQAGALPAGITPKDYGDARGEIRDTFSGVVKAVFSKDNYDDVVDHLSKTDRDRLQTGNKRYSDQLNRSIDQFTQAWKSKYNDDFSISADQSFSEQFLSASTGEVSNPEQVSHWPLPPTGKGEKAAETSKPAMNRGTGVAVAAFTGAPGQSPLHVSLDREGTDWKIDIPDNISSDQFQSSLARHIDKVTQVQSQWPSDRASAERFVTYHILKGLYNVSERGEQGGAHGTMQGQGSQERQRGQESQGSPSGTQEGSTEEEM